MAGLHCSLATDSTHDGVELRYLLPRKLWQRTHVVGWHPHRGLSEQFHLVCRQGYHTFPDMHSSGDILLPDF